MARNLGTLQTLICYNLHVVRWLIGNPFKTRIPNSGNQSKGHDKSFFNAK